MRKLFIIALCFFCLAGYTQTLDPTYKTVKADSIRTATKWWSDYWWLQFNSKGTGSVTSISTTSPLTGGVITTTGVISMTQANSTTNGWLSYTDWVSFNNKKNSNDSILNYGYFTNFKSLAKINYSDTLTKIATPYYVTSHITPGVLTINDTTEGSGNKKISTTYQNSLKQNKTDTVNTTTNGVMSRYDYLQMLYNSPAKGLTFSGVVDLTNHINSNYNNYTISTNLTITISSNPIDGSYATVVIIGDGTHTPVVTGLYGDLTRWIITSGQKNYITFSQINGITYFVINPMTIN